MRWRTVSDSLHDRRERYFFCPLDSFQKLLPADNALLVSDALVGEYFEVGSSIAVSMCFSNVGKILLGVWCNLSKD